MSSGSDRPDRGGGPPTGSSPSRGWLVRLAWLPLPLFLAALLALWAADLRTPHESVPLLLFFNLVFSVLVCAFIAYVVGQSFLVRSAPGLLLLGCGVLVWGAAGFVGVIAGLMLADGRLDDNALITVHNSCVCLSGLCHLAGVGLSFRPRRAPGPAGLWLGGVYALALGAVGFIVAAARTHRTPIFFVQGQGGPPVRDLVLGVALVAFALTALLLQFINRRSPSAFARWYSLGLGLIAVGVFGIAIESVHGGALSWTSRAAQFLSGVYLLAAAVASARETGTWRVSLGEEAWEQPAVVWDDWLLRVLTAPYTRALPPGWRYTMAVAVAAAAVSLRWALIPWLGTGGASYLFPLLATVVSTLLLGLGPGLLTMVVGDLAVEAFLVGAPFGTAMSVLRLGLAMVIGAFVVLVLHGIRVAQLRARRSEARLAAFGAATLEGIGESRAGRIVDCNEQLAQMMGATVAELRGAAIADFIAPEDRDRVMENILANRESAIEHAMERKDGTRIIVETRGRPAAPDSPVRYTVVRDVTERRQTEDALRESEERYRDLYENAPTGYFSVGTDGCIRRCNRQAGELLGRSTEQLVGRPVLELYADTPQGKEKAQRVMERFRAGEAVHHEEMEMRHADGSSLWVDLSVSPVRDEAQVVESRSVVVDITARKQAEEALRESLERLKRTEGIAHLGSWELDCRANRLSWSDEVYRIFGLEPQEFGATYEAFLEAVHPEDRAAVDEAYTGSLRRGESSYEIEHRVVRRTTGEIRWVHEKCEHVTDDAGRVLRSIGMVLDITDRKHNEQALTEAERARTRMAEALTSEIAHRTKNNLAIVAGLLQLQLDGDVAPDAHADLIRDAVTRIMSFAALHEQMYQRHSEAVELLDALRRIAEVDRQAIATGEVEISVEGDPAEYPSSIATNLCVVANELITNAVKHGGPQDGSRRVEVTLLREDGRLVISVWNSGNPVPADFDLAAGSKTGLGLVRAIVEDQYRGSFTLVPERGGTLARLAFDEEELLKK